MRVPALLALVAGLVMLASAAFDPSWSRVNTSDSMLSDGSSLASLLGGFLPPAIPRTEFPLGALAPFGPDTPVEGYTWPAVFLVAFGTLSLLTRPKGEAQLAAQREFKLNAKDGSVLLRSSALTITLAAFERSLEGVLSFQVLVSNSSDDSLGLVRVFRGKEPLAELRELGPGELKSLELHWGQVSGEQRIVFEYSRVQAPGESRHLSVLLPWDEVVELFASRKSLVTFRPPAPAVTPGAVATPAQVAEDIEVVRQHQREVMEKLKQKAQEARKTAETLTVPTAARPVLPELAPGVSLLVEGAVASKKGDFALEMVKRAVEQNKELAWCSFDPQRDVTALPEAQRAKVSQFEAMIALEDTGIVISSLAQQKPALGIFDMLYRYTPKYSLDMLLKFLAFNLSKLREAGVPSLWLVESTLEPRALASLEGEFDVVIEFIVREEQGQLVSYFRVKKFKGSTFSTELRRWG